jgi:hypothetical protein
MSLGSAKIRVKLIDCLESLKTLSFPHAIQTTKTADVVKLVDTLS